MAITTITYPTAFNLTSDRSITKYIELPLRKDCGSTLPDDRNCTFNETLCQQDQAYYQPVCTVDWCLCGYFDGELGGTNPNDSNLYLTPNFRYHVTDPFDPGAWNILTDTYFKIDCYIIYEAQKQPKGTIVSIVANLDDIAPSFMISIFITNTGQVGLYYRSTGRANYYLSDTCILKEGERYKIEVISQSSNSLEYTYSLRINGIPYTFYYDYINSIGNDPLFGNGLIESQYLIIGTNTNNKNATPVPSPFTGYICGIDIYSSGPDSFNPSIDYLVQSIRFTCNTIPYDNYRATILGKDFNTNGGLKCTGAIDGYSYELTENLGLTDLYFSENSPLIPYGSNNNFQYYNIITGNTECGGGTGPKAPETAPQFSTYNNFNDWITGFVAYWNAYWEIHYEGTVTLMTDNRTVRFITNVSKFQAKTGADICVNGLDVCIVNQTPEEVDNTPLIKPLKLSNICCNPELTCDTACMIKSKLKFSKIQNPHLSYSLDFMAVCDGSPPVATQPPGPAVGEKLMSIYIPIIGNTPADAAANAVIAFNLLGPAFHAYIDPYDGDNSIATFEAPCTILKDCPCSGSTYFYWYANTFVTATITNMGILTSCSTCNTEFIIVDGTLISDVGVSGEFNSITHNPFRKTYCDLGVYCEDNRLCLDDERLTFQFQMPDIFNDFINPINGVANAYIWKGNTQGNWFATVIAHSLDPDNPESILYENFVEKAFVGYLKEGQKTIQQITINTALLPCKFYFEFIFNMGSTCNNLTFYSEDYSKETCGPLLNIEGIYPLKGKGSYDCDKYYYGLVDIAYGDAPYYYSNLVKVRGSVELKSLTYERETVQNYSSQRVVSIKETQTALLRIGNIPEYVLQKLRIAFMAENVYFNGEPYIVTGEIAKGDAFGRMWAIETDLQKIPDCSTLNFTCD